MRDYFNGEENNLFQNHLYNSFLGNNKHFPNVIREYRHFDFSPLFDHNRFLRYDNNNLLPSRSLPPCYQYRSKPFRYDYITEMLVKMKIDDVEKVFPSKLIDLEISEDIE
ncbi:32428_t:CDS:2 [Gigaspora margarita]|uniref:32428_t:CDS:1 n=1 Tax=Gigaspora margarita TaxID=4874 RepID=A0ABN7VKX6_GIGMA|nr:32428_t:CDS:2 [Gigaspora margarita]